MTPEENIRIAEAMVLGYPRNDHSQERAQAHALIAIAEILLRIAQKEGVA